MLSESQGEVKDEKRIWVSIDWTKVPSGSQTGSVAIASGVSSVITVKVESFKGLGIEIESEPRTDSAMTVFPITSGSLSPGKDAPWLEYKMYLFHAGPVKVEALFDPTLNFVPGRGLRYAIAFDDNPPQIIDLLADRSTEAWATSVKDSARKSVSAHTIVSPGYHTLKVWMVDPGVVLQKLVVDLGGVKPSYLGPPESFHVLPERSAAAQTR